MDKDMLLRIILPVFVYNIQSVNAYSFQSDQAYHTENKTWKAASAICGENGLEFDENVLKNIAVLQDKKFWIGMAIYRIATPWIESMENNKIYFTNPYGMKYVLSENKRNKYRQTHQNQMANAVFTGQVSDNGDGNCTTLKCTTGSNGLKSANCNDATDNGRISICPEAGTKEPLYCLAVTFTEQNAKRELNITRRDCNDQLQFVCRIDEVLATTQGQSTLNTRKMKKYSSSSLDIGAVIGGVLGTCSLITVLAGLIVCKVRSKGMFTESNTHNYEDTSRVNFSNTTYEDLHNTKQKVAKATSNQNYDIVEDSAPVYDEVNECEKQTKCIS
ncbi:unnamed protein product [Mytilus edulis]|uniref:C-type lectin domain-containing protein n=1 Tax=Mytilus edulis TaxID=6550 RepID=A0A8S3QVN9_MYTED|nr:unnamed protein product [Mytilus edulis]